MEKGSGWYDRYYKFFLAVAVLILLSSLGYIAYFYSQNGDIMKKDITLTGGTSITVYGDANTDELSKFLTSKLKDDFSIRKLEDITTRKIIAFVLETRASTNDTKSAVEEFLKYPLTEQNSSIEISGESMAKSFYKQLLIALGIAFIFMATVVFVIFRTFVPSITVVFAAATDIIGALALVDLLGLKVSTAGIAAFLMLIGYSVDTDTMLTTKTIKRKGEGTVNERIYSAFKTGIMMTTTSLAAVLVGYFIAQGDVLKEIFLILSCGLIMDILITWLGNASILKLYCEKKNI